MKENASFLAETFPPFRSLEFSTPQLFASLINITLIPFFIVAFSLRGKLTTEKIMVMLGLQSIVFWNALLPHISGLFVLGTYNPGTVSAIVINIPFSIYLFHQANKLNLLTEKKIVIVFIAGLLAYLPLVYLNHLAAHQIIKFF